jgi:serine/threonine-protein kinase
MDVTGELHPGRTFAGDFRVERLLASGGMGSVYVAEQLSTGKRRALKVLHPQFVRDESGRRRFAQEARVGGEIDSDHVVEVVGAGVDETTGTPWLAMELLEGQDLAAFVQSRGRLDPPTTRAVLEQLCDALARAHARGVVHRDLKPENVFIAAPRRRGVAFTLKILDFGIAKIVQENRAAATGSMTIGSPLWMAPEQAVSAAPISPATDVWAIGLIAFWLLTGVSYWSNAPTGTAFNLPALLVEVMTAPLEPASLRAQRLGVGAALPMGFDGWFAGCVTRDPGSRFPHAGVAFDALAALLDARSSMLGTVPLSAPPAPPVGTMPMRVDAAPPQGFAPVAPPPRPPKRSSVVYGLAGIALVGLFAVIGFSTAADAPLPTPTADEEPPPPPTSATTTSPVIPTPPAVAAPRPRTAAAPSPVPTQPPRAGAGAGAEIVRERMIRGNTSLGRGDVTGGEGEIDASRVASLVGGQLGGIRSCYERALRNNPTLSGRIDVRFTIAESGRATSVTPSGMSEAPEVGSCAASAIRRISFPEPRGGAVEFSFPFTFNPGG